MSALPGCLTVIGPERGSMNQWTWASGRVPSSTAGRSQGSGERLVADGGHEAGTEDDDTGDNDTGDNDTENDKTEDASERDSETDSGGDDTPNRSHGNVDITEPGEAEPVDPKWEEPDIENVEDIPEVSGPKTRPADSDRVDSPESGKSAGTAGERTGADAGVSGSQAGSSDPTAGMPNAARSPEQSRLKKGGADGYVAALELCARLPEDMRLPEEAADLVPVALEAELEDTVQQFAGDQFDNPSPHVETLDFVDVDDEIWLRLRLGIPTESFADLDPEEIQEHALQELEGMF